uniref:VWFA domain-containing protein n=1 Tax=Plectus sambesii TaxID=2011161 RepID=A0A914W0F5_9BILA
MSVFLLAVFCLIRSTSGQFDGITLTGAYGQAVTHAAIRELQDSCIFSNDRQLMRRLSWVTTSFGNDPATFVQNINGLWGMSEEAFNRTKNPAWFNNRYSQILADIKSEFGIDYQKLEWRNGAILVPIEAAIAERMFIESLNLTIPYEVEQQAQLWRQYFAPERNVSEQVFIEQVALMPNVCRSVGADVLFLMDSSGSITAPNWRIMQDFVISIIDQFPIGEDAYKFAVDVFNDGAASLITFNAYHNISTLQRLINVLPYVQGDTRTDLALVNAVTRSFTPESGMRDASRGFPRVAILITDGMSSFANRTKVAADMAKQAGIVLLTIGIADADEKELTYAASEPKCMRTFLLSNFAALVKGFPAELLAQTCQSNALLAPGDTGIAGRLQRDQYLYFHMQLNSTTGATYRVNLTEGAVTLYLSNTVSQPDEARYDYAINVTADAEGQLFLGRDQLMGGIDQSVINQVIAANNWTLIPLYASVRGTGDSNNFTLSVDQNNQPTNITVPPTDPPSTLATVQAQSPSTGILIAVIAGIVLLCLIVGAVLVYYMRYVRYTVNPNENDL